MLVPRKCKRLRGLNGRELIEHRKLCHHLLLVGLSYLITGALSTLALWVFGYPLIDCVFETVSAMTNSGLSVGIGQPGMPAIVKWVLMLDMAAGRLNFVAVVVLLAPRALHYLNGHTLATPPPHKLEKKEPNGNDN